MSYYSPPASPISGFFPTGPSSPHAFSSFGNSPRDTHDMYAALGSSRSSSSSNTQVKRQSSSNPFKKLVSRK
ncbi:hypothetical protein QCA50_002274 [Cerrena zonata]|uniref:Uncharacterized protein n=1 Tax=Cerrena zonata TaxID=2478898 RepID=A0AAW0GT89_9APHY